MTRPTELVLEQLLAADEPVWGLLLCKQTGLPSGTVYPMLARLEGYSWVVASWDDSDTQGPRRRLYSITDDGRRAIEAALQEARSRNALAKGATKEATA